MPIIQSISDHRAAVEALPAASLYNALENNNVYKLQKTTSSGTIECYIKITDKTPLLFPNTSTIYDCSITGPAVYLEISSSGDIKTGEIGIRTISNLMSNKTHIASDNWIVYTSSASEYNTKVDLVIDNVSAGTTSGSSGEITSVSDHWTAVRNLPASNLYYVLYNNSVYKLTKIKNGQKLTCYIKITNKIPITFSNTNTIRDGIITGPAIYIEEDSLGNITHAEIGIREIDNVISNKTHIASDNWLIYSSSSQEFNSVVDDILYYINNSEPDQNHLSFTSKQDNSTVYIQTNSASEIPPDFEYSYDTINWSTWSYTTTGTNPYVHTFSTISLNYNDRIYIRSHANSLGSSSAQFSKFYMSGRIAAAGNIQSLINYSSYVPSYCYYNLFQGCTSLISSPQLPAISLLEYCYSYMFSGCSSLTSAPELPATTLADYCYQYMFQSCASLVEPPMLPATTLARNCYEYMFNNCTSLIHSPDLPAIIMKLGCYQNMFYGCTSLTTAPALPATIMVDNCYLSMFQRCTKLIKPPELPATVLAYRCYDSMFNGCTSLTTAPALPATETATYCYRYMFRGCTKLTSAPTLPATTLQSYCYQYMFSGCSSLTECADMQYATSMGSSCCAYMYQNCTKLNNAISPNISTWQTSYFTNWLSGTASTGTVYKPSNLTIPTNSVSGIPTGWNSGNYIKKVRLSAIEDHAAGFVYRIDGTTYTLDDNTETTVTLTQSQTIEIVTNDVIRINYIYKYVGNQILTYDECVDNISCIPFTEITDIMYFTANQSGSTISMSHSGTNQSSTKPKLYISTNLTSFIEWDYSSIILSDIGSKLYVFGCNTSISSGPSNYSAFSITGSVSVNGDVQSLLGFSNIVPTYGYYRLFNQCPITSAPYISAIKVNQYGCQYMFNLCTSLISVPNITPDILSSYCYHSMFSGCTSLTTAPELPVTTLSSYCYTNMFSGCSSLIHTPKLGAISLASHCYDGMFSGCSSLTTAPELPATTLADYCYSSMFRRCSSLTIPPELPATTLASYCYSYMFYDCTSLITTPALPATNLADYCYQYMFYRCTSLDVVPDLPATVLRRGCYSYMFQGCTELSSIPVLPAYNIVYTGCYTNMFYGCSQISHIIVSATSWNTSNTANWVYGVATTGTFEKPSATNIPTGANGIPSGWTVINN